MRPVPQKLAADDQQQPQQQPAQDPQQPQQPAQDSQQQPQQPAQDPAPEPPPPPGEPPRPPPAEVEKAAGDTTGSEFGTSDRPYTHSAYETQEMIKEGFHCLERCVADRADRFPKPHDRAADFAQKRNHLLNKIVPISIVPLATSNAMLFMGSRKKTGPEGDCAFPLPQYLIWAGAMSLSLVIFGVVARHVLIWVLEDKYVSQGEETIVSVLEYIGNFMALLQGAILLSGTVVLFPHLPTVNLRDRADAHYCDRGIVIFSTVFLGMCWVFVLFGVGAYIYIKCTADDVADEVKAHLMKELLDDYRTSEERPMSPKERLSVYDYLQEMQRAEKKRQRDDEDSKKFK